MHAAVTHYEGREVSREASDAEISPADVCLACRQQSDALGPSSARLVE